MAEIPRLDSITQSIAVSGFTDDGRESAHLDLTDLIPVGSIVQGWKASITTRFTGGLGGRVYISVGTPDAPEAFSATGRKTVTLGASSTLADVPAAGQAVENIGNARRVRVTIADDVDFANVTGGALTVSVYYVRTAV